MTVGGTKNLPIRFYDCPGIDNDEDETMDLDVLEAIINGHIKGDSKVHKLLRKHSLSALIQLGDTNYNHTVI